MKQKLMIAGLILTAFAASMTNTTFAAGWPDDSGYQPVFEPCGDGTFEKWCDDGALRRCFERYCL